MFYDQSASTVISGRNNPFGFIALLILSTFVDPVTVYYALRAHALDVVAL